MGFCTYCGQSFSSDNCLERHILTHTNVKPFKCFTCNSSFARRDLLQRHYTIHSRSEGNAGVSSSAFKPTKSLPRASLTAGRSLATPVPRSINGKPEVSKNDTYSATQTEKNLFNGSYPTIWHMDQDQPKHHYVPVAVRMGTDENAIMPTAIARDDEKGTASFGIKRLQGPFWGKAWKNEATESSQLRPDYSSTTQTDAADHIDLWPKEKWPYIIPYTVTRLDFLSQLSAGLTGCHWLSSGTNRSSIRDPRFIPNDFGSFAPERLMASVSLSGNCKELDSVAEAVSRLNQSRQWRNPAHMPLWVASSTVFLSLLGQAQAIPSPAGSSTITEGSTSSWTLLAALVLAKTLIVDIVGTEKLALAMFGFSLSWPIVKTDPRSPIALLYSVYLASLIATGTYGHSAFSTYSDPHLPLLWTILLATMISALTLLSSQEGMQAALVFLPVTLSLCTYVIASFNTISTYVGGGLGAFSRIARHIVEGSCHTLGATMIRLGQNWSRTRRDERVDLEEGVRSTASTQS